MRPRPPAISSFRWPRGSCPCRRVPMSRLELKWRHGYHDIFDPCGEPGWNDGRSLCTPRRPPWARLLGNEFHAKERLELSLRGGARQAEPSELRRDTVGMEPAPAAFDSAGIRPEVGDGGDCGSLATAGTSKHELKRAGGIWHRQEVAQAHRQAMRLCGSHPRVRRRPRGSRPPGQSPSRHPAPGRPLCRGHSCRRRCRGPCV